MTEQAVNHHEEDEISLLDIFVTLAESWKLLVFGPLIAAVLAGALSFLWPPTFVSVAIVRLTEEDVALLHAAPVLDALIEKYGLLAGADGIVDDARRELKKRLIFAVDKKTKLATITGKARTPDAAHVLTGDAIAALLKELQVKGQDKELLEKTISINKQAISNAEDALDSIQHRLRRGGLTDQAQESIIKNFAQINSDIAKFSQENEGLRNRLAPKGAEVFVQQASFPQRKEYPKLLWVFVLTAIAVNIVLIISVFVRKGWVIALQDEITARKLNSIKKSIGF